VIKPGERRVQPPAAAQKLVGEPDHARIRPGLRPQFQQTSKNSVFVFARVRLGQKTGHGGGRARYSDVAMHQKMAFGQLRRIRQLAAEIQNRLNMLFARHHEAGRGLYGIVKAQHKPVRAIEGPQRLRLGIIRV
jgi:hypothetical protein